jgi:hypothetical protein
MKEEENVERNKTKEQRKKEKGKSCGSKRLNVRYVEKQIHKHEMRRTRKQIQKEEKNRTLKKSRSAVR